jgi:hypothetical protein
VTDCNRTRLILLAEASMTRSPDSRRVQVLIECKAKASPTPEVPIVIWAGWHVGDVIEPAEVNGFVPSALEAWDWLVAAIARVADSFGRLCVSCAAGSRNR